MIVTSRCASRRDRSTAPVIRSAASRPDSSAVGTPDARHGRRAGQHHVVDAAHRVGGAERSGLGEGVGERERCARRHALPRPVRGVDDVQQLGVVAELGQPVATVPRSCCRRTSRRSRPSRRCRAPDSAQAPGRRAGRGPRAPGWGRWRSAGSPAATDPPSPAVVDDVVERLLPRVAEQDVCGARARQPTARQPTWATTADGAGRSGSSRRGVRPSSR